MRMERFTYQEAESCLYEGMRWKGTNGKILAEREGRSRIDEEATVFNVTYAKECLMPKGEFRSKKYAREHRGEAIAEYHNSQTPSQSRAMMSGQRASNAVGLVATLPRDNPWLQRAELTDEEFDYMRDRMIERPHDSSANTRDEALEASIREKLTRVSPTPEEREQVNAFLLAVKDAWLEVCGIRQEDVLFYAIHWDETYPHIHCLALPTVEKTYEEDVYSKRTKKDGTHTLLHKAGETTVTYSVARFYEDAYYGDDGKRHYPFMESYHQRVIETMQGKQELSDEMRQTASALLNGATKNQAPFNPRDFSREQRDESVLLSEANRALRLENEKKNKEIDELSSELLSVQEKLSAAQTEVLAEQAKALDAKKELAATKSELSEAKADVSRAKALAEEAEASRKAAEEMVEELDEQRIRLSRQIDSMTRRVRELLGDVKAAIKLVVEQAIASFLPAWRKATREGREQVEADAVRSVEEALTGPVEELEAEASSILESEPLREVNLSPFTPTPQRMGFAVGQIKKATTGTPYEAQFAPLTKENAEENALMKLCLDDWFNREKYGCILPAMTEDAEVEYMKSPNRAARALAYMKSCIEAGLVEVEDLIQEL